MSGQVEFLDATTGRTQSVSEVSPLPVNVVDSNASSAASTGGGNNTYSNVTGDFTATANSGAKTITLSSYASTTLSSVISALNFANAVIKRVTSAGVVDTLPLTNVSFSTNVLTLSDMTANFAVGDTVAVFVPGPDKSFDETNDRNKVAEQLSPTYEDNSVGVAKTEEKGASYFTISSATTTTVRSGAGRLVRLYVAGGTMGNVTVYDNTAGSGTTILPTSTVVQGQELVKSSDFGTGLTIVTSAATILVGTYR